MGPGDLDPRVDSLSRRRRRSRLHRRSARRAVFLVPGLVMVLVAGACAAVTGVFVNDPAALVRCDLGSQHVQTLGRSTFVSASDGSRLGVVPSTRNREPVPLGRMSPWLLKATVAIEDARFWTRAGALDLQAITRAAVADVRAGTIVEGGSTIPQQLARDRYLRAPAPTLSRKLQEACLATQLEQRHSRRADPAGLPRRRLLRPPRLRGAGRGRDLLLAAGRPPDDGAGGAARRAPAGTHRVRPARASRRGAPAPARGARRAARFGGDLGAARSGGRPRLAASAARRALRRRRAAALLRVRPARADREGRALARDARRAERAHDARPAHAALGDCFDRSLARPARPAGRRAGRDRPVDGRDSRDVRRGAGPSGSGVQPREPVAPAGGQHVQDVHAGGGDGGGHPAPVGVAGAARADDLRSALHERHGAVGRAQLRRRGAGHDVAAAGDRVLGEHDLRAGRHEGRPAGHRERRAPDGDPVGAGARLLDHAGAGGRLAARDDRRLRDARRPRHPPHAELAGRGDRCRTASACWTPRETRGTARSRRASPSG